MTDAWALHNTLKGWTFYDLSTREVHLLVQAMSPNEIRLAKVAIKNSSQWSSVSPSVAEHAPFFKKIVSSSDDYPQLTSDRGTTTTGAVDTDTDYFVVKKRTEVTRLHKRYDISVPCVISSSTKNFETESVNISGGGLQFKDLLPAWIAGYFIVSVTANDSIIQLMCSLVEDQKEKKRVQIVSEETDDQYLLYKHWLSTLD